MKIKVLLLNYWVRLCLAGLGGFIAYFILLLVFSKIGLDPNGFLAPAISAIITGVSIFCIVWFGLWYNKGPLKFSQ